MNEGLLEDESAVFPLVFASLVSTRKRNHFFPQSCAPREARCANSYRIIATKERIHGKILI